VEALLWTPAARPHPLRKGGDRRPVDGRRSPHQDAERVIHSGHLRSGSV